MPKRIGAHRGKRDERAYEILRNSFSQHRTRLGRRDERKIANNTWLISAPTTPSPVRKHRTDVVTFYAGRSHRA